MGDIMKELDRAEELLCKGIKEITDRDMLDASSLDNLKDAILGVEKIYKTRHYASEDNKDRNGYSPTYQNYSGNRFPMTYPMMYQYGDNEYDTRHSHNMNYDNTNGGSTNGMNNYSRGSMLEHLEKALNEASTEQEREAIRRIIADRR